MLSWLYLNMSHTYIARHIRVHVKLHLIMPFSSLSLTRDKTLPEFEIARSSSRKLGKPLPNLARRRFKFAALNSNSLISVKDNTHQLCM